MKKKYIISVCAVVLVLLLGVVCDFRKIGRVYAEVTEAMGVTTESIAEKVTENNKEESGGEGTSGNSTEESGSEEGTSEESTEKEPDGEQKTEETTTEEVTEEPTTEEMPQEPADEIPPAVELLCIDEDGKAKEEILCHITISEEDFPNCKNIIYVERTDFQNKTEQTTIEDVVFENGVKKEVAFSEEGYYQIYVQSTDGTGNETVSEMITFLIDRTMPNITVDTGGMIENGCYETKKEKRNITFEIEDYSLIKDSCKVTILHNMEREKIVSCEWTESSEGRKTTVVLDETFEEGSYKIMASAQDEAGNEMVKEWNFVIDNTPAEVEMKCDTDCEKWTDQDVVFQTRIEDSVSGIKEIVYKIKGEVVKKLSFEERIYSYYQEVVASEEADKASGYSVVVEVTNWAGLKQTVKRQVYIDKTKPEITLSGVRNGEYYADNQFITTNVIDMSYKGTKTEYYVTHILDGKSKEIKIDAFVSGKYEDRCVRELTQEGRYEIYAIATDSVGNNMKSNTLSFVIDKTAPVVEVHGIEEDAMTADTVTLQLCCRESFYETNEVVLEIERTLDGKTTTERVDGVLKDGKKSVMEKQFAKDGTYHVTIWAKDRAGNPAQEEQITFSVDKTKPEIGITGTENYQLWSEPMSLRFRVVESYYKDNQVVISGTRKDMDGKVETLYIPMIRNSGKVSGMLQTFEEDGIYEIQMRAKDQAGNENSMNVHFVIDRTNPEIFRVGKYDGGYYTSFRLADSMEDIFKDLTVVSYQIRLNGVEYNGTDEITQEGKYNLQVEVQDELGHASRKSVEFIIDHTPPQIRFGGVTEGEKVQMAGTVSLALADADDRITGVRVNGVEQDADVRELSYTEEGAYRIEVDCEDKAGNKATETLSFLYDSVEPTSHKSQVNILPVMCIFGICVLGICVMFQIRIIRKRRGEQEL